MIGQKIRFVSVCIQRKCVYTLAEQDNEKETLTAQFFISENNNPGKLNYITLKQHPGKIQFPLFIKTSREKKQIFPFFFLL